MAEDILAAQMAAQAQQQAELQRQMGLNDSMFLNTADADVQNSRQFYLAYEELLADLTHFWKGEVKNDKGEWVKIKGAALMNDTAANVLIMILNASLSKPVRLANFRQEDVMRLAYQSRERIAGWLSTEGWLKYDIPVAYLAMISHQCELLIYASLLWGLNGGGQRFMTTSGRSIENVSQILAPQAVGGQQAGSGRTQQNRGTFLGMPKFWK